MNAMPAVALKVNDLPVVRGKKAKPLTKGKVIKLPVRRRSKGLSPKKREALVIEYRGKARKLARSILRKWHCRLDLEEVDSIVDLSLCEAVQRFDPAKGASFMTFFFYHLRGNLIRAVSTAANANSIPLPDIELEMRSGVCGEEGRSGHQGGNAIEVAEALCGHDSVLPDEALLKKELASLSQRACAKLDNLEREVISRVYMDEQQLMDIAKTLGYSRCHISRVKRKALETLFAELKAAAPGEEWIAAARLDDEDAEDGEIRRPVQRRRPRANKLSLMTPQRMAILEATR